MKLHVAFSLLFIGHSAYAALADKIEIDQNSVPHGQHITLANAKSSPGFSVMLYLSLMDGTYSSIMASQLTVTPTTTYTVRAIQVTTYNSTDGSCSNGQSTYNTNPWVIDNGAGVTITLTNGHSYLTTDASNYALFNNPNTFAPQQNDTLYQLLDNNLSAIGSSGCIGASTDIPNTCQDATDCGWSSPKTWTP